MISPGTMSVGQVSCDIPSFDVATLTDGLHPFELCKSKCVVLQVTYIYIHRMGTTILLGYIEYREDYIGIVPQ